MTIEITGVNTHNKGAELMLLAILQHFQQWPHISLAVEPWFGSYNDRAKYGLRQKVDVPRFGRSWLATELMPVTFRRAYGLAVDEDIHGILDASGFAFGDQHPLSRIISFAEKLERARKQEKPIVLLPQAFGPFDQKDSRAAFRRVVSASDLVFARDQISFECATEAAGAELASRILMAPDFTNLLKPESTRNQRQSGRVCLVPNQRMIEKATSREQADAYLPFLKTCVELVESHGLEPLLLVHGADDGALAEELSSMTGHSVPTIHEQDPLAIKTILGESHIVIGSRFHALVSALSQGVPAIGTSWSHKYEMLFKDYECEGMLLSVGADRERIEAAIGRAAGPERETLVKRLVEAGGRLQQEVKNMWSRVDAVMTTAVAAS